MAENDPYKYFRIEARELLDSLTQGVLELEKGGAGKDVIGRMLRHAHTLKGAARIVQQKQVAELSHGIEDILALHRDTGTRISRDDISRLLGLVDGIAAGLKTIAPAAPGSEPAFPAPTPQPVEEPLATVRIEIGDLDALLREASEAAVHVTAMKREAATLDQALRLAAKLERPRTAKIATEPDAEELRRLLHQIRQNLSSVTEKAQRELAGVQDRAGQLRLLPASTMFASLQRAARDAAEALHKQVNFQASGGDIRVDAHVLRALRDALVHVVRNAVAHGIESPAQRQSAGKPPQGQVQLRVERRGDRAVFTCQDDGRGIDVAQVRQVAIERGLVSAAQAESLSPEAAIRLLLAGGVTTTRSVNEVSGRGVGLDVVRETVSRLKGEVNATTEASRSTSICISVPISLEALTVLEVEASGLVISLPFDCVVGSLRLGQHELARSPQGDAIIFQDEAVPFAPLARLLQPAGALPRSRPWSVVVLQSGSKRAAIGVERLLGRSSIVMRPLPPLAGHIDLAAGASFDSEGNPQLVLDPAGLVRAVSRHAPSSPEPAAPRRAPLLVIDDSLTTRMLEQSILQTAGYEVDLAVSGEEGLQKARQKRYAMFVVDIEMPGINGFEFIEQVRSDAQLRGIPAILVTSRASPEDRKRGEQVGAGAYIIKSEFNEGQLLGTIRSLIG